MRPLPRTPSEEDVSVRCDPSRGAVKPANSPSSDPNPAGRLLVRTGSLCQDTFCQDTVAVRTKRETNPPTDGTSRQSLRYRRLNLSEKRMRYDQRKLEPIVLAPPGTDSCHSLGRRSYWCRAFCQTKASVFVESIFGTVICRAGTRENRSENLPARCQLVSKRCDYNWQGLVLKTEKDACPSVRQTIGRPLRAPRRFSGRSSFRSRHGCSAIFANQKAELCAL